MRYPGMLTNDMDGGQDRTARDWQGIVGGTSL